jgi:hypothetical protein
MTEWGLDRAFFERWRSLTELMTLVEILPEGHLYYYEPPYDGGDVWVVVGKSELMVAYSCFESHTKIAEWSRSGTKRSSNA